MRVATCGPAGPGFLTSRSSGLKRSHDPAHLVELEAWQALEDLRGVAAAEIAQEVRFRAAVAEEGGVHLGVVEARHGAAVETDRARREDEIGALQRAVAPGMDRRVGLALEPGARRLIVREHARQVLVEMSSASAVKLSCHRSSWSMAPLRVGS